MDKNKTYKLTIDLNYHNKLKLDEIKQSTNMPLGSIINTLINTFANIPDRIKSELLLDIKSRILNIEKEINKLDSSSEDFYKNTLSNNRDAYYRIGKFLNDGENITIEESEKQEHKKYPIKNGVLSCPKDWIVLNLEEAHNMEYAGVIECRNSKSFGMKHFNKAIPHFVFFSNIKYATDYNKNYINHINNLCREKWSDFDVVINSQVAPIYDPTNPCKILNEYEYLNAPTIGYFSIYEQGDPTYSSNYEPPAGARIIRQ